MAMRCRQSLDDLHAATALGTYWFRRVVVDGDRLRMRMFDHCRVAGADGRCLLGRPGGEELADTGEL